MREIAYVSGGINRMATARRYLWEDFGNRRAHSLLNEQAEIPNILMQISENGHHGARHIAPHSCGG
jgi:hypothetical protein